MFLKFPTLGIISICILLLAAQETESYQCYRCQGSDCQKESKLRDITECEDIMDDCVSVFGESKILERGCYSSLPIHYRKICDDYNATTCHRCYEDHCNDRGPSKCLQCNSNDDWNCFYNPIDIEPSYCPISLEVHNSCYVRNNSSGIMERGCFSNRQQLRECDASPSCEVCVPQAGIACNNEFQPIIMGASSVSGVYGLVIAVAIFGFISLKWL